MAESPDYQPIEFSPYPPDPTDYIAASQFTDLTSGTTSTTLVTLQASELFLVKSFVAQGTIANLSTTAPAWAYVAIVATRGLADAGVEIVFDQAYFYLPAGVTGQVAPFARFALTAPNPVVCRGGVPGTPNLLQLQAGFTSGSGHIAVTSNVIGWDLS